MSVVCMSGECSEKAANILLPQKSYSQKVLYKLTGDKLIYKYQKEGMKGYRLTKKGKETMLLIDPKRFGFFLENGADFSMRRSSLTHRERQHRISEVLAIMLQSGILIYLDKKPHVFAKNCEEYIKIKELMYFQVKEVKEQGMLTRKICNSRITGVLLSSNDIWFCYNMGYNNLSWFNNVENRADIVICSMLKEKGLTYKMRNVILFGDSIEQALFCLEDYKTRAFVLNVSFNKFCFVPLNKDGILQLKLLSDYEKYNCLITVLSEDLHKDLHTGELIENDGYNSEGQPVLIAVDFDMKRLLRFILQLQYTCKRGEIICFDFQKEVIKSYCGKEADISAVDFEIFRKSFFPEECKN